MLERHSDEAIITALAKALGEGTQVRFVLRDEFFCVFDLYVKCDKCGRDLKTIFWASARDDLKYQASRTARAVARHKEWHQSACLHEDHARCSVCWYSK